MMPYRGNTPDDQMRNIRDLFAMAAIIGLCGAAKWDSGKALDAESIAENAYKIADAMLTVREDGHEEIGKTTDQAMIGELLETTKKTLEMESRAPIRDEIMKMIASSEATGLPMMVEKLNKARKAVPSLSAREEIFKLIKEMDESREDGRRPSDERH